jgi:hypothetical protein
MFTQSIFNLPERYRQLVNEKNGSGRLLTGRYNRSSVIFELIAAWVIAFASGMAYSI